MSEELDPSDRSRPAGFDDRVRDRDDDRVRGVAGGVSGSAAEERTWAMLAHLSAFSTFVVPFGSILGPLLVWLIKKDTMPFAADQAKEALNFNITVLIAVVASLILFLVIVGIPLLIVVSVAWLVLTIVAAVQANSGIAYRYPLTLRLVK